MGSYIILDTETNNIKPGQITQLAYLIVENDKIVKTENYFFTVESLTPEIVELTGKTLATINSLAGGFYFKDSAIEILDDLKRGVIVAHNADYDKSFLEKEFSRVGLDFDSEFICTMKQSQAKIRDYYGIQKRMLSLTDLKNIFNVSDIYIKALLRKHFPDAVNCTNHDARYDCIVLYLVYLELLKGDFISERV